MKNETLKECLSALLEKAKTQPAISIREILKILSGNGRVLILIFLSLPFCQPLQIPGLSIPFGLLIAFIAFRMTFGKHVWLPKIVLLKTIPSSTVSKISKKLLKLMAKISKLVHPRLSWLCKNKIMHTLNGILIVFLGIFLALPLPIPLTNLLAGWDIFLISLGLLGNDGVFVLTGYFASIITVATFVFLSLSIKMVL